MENEQEEFEEKLRYVEEEIVKLKNKNEEFKSELNYESEEKEILREQLEEAKKNVFIPDEGRLSWSLIFSEFKSSIPVGDVILFQLFVFVFELYDLFFNIPQFFFKFFLFIFHVILSSLESFLFLVCFLLSLNQVINAFSFRVGFIYTFMFIILSFLCYQENFPSFLFFSITFV